MPTAPRLPLWRILLLAGALLAPFLGRPARAAEPCTDCVLPTGAYHVVAPPGWDGKTPLPLLLFLHGYGATGQDMVEDPAVGPPAAKLGFLLVAPDGRNHAWTAIGTPARAAPAARDDIAFLHAVLADVARRWPIDPHMIVLGGFSLGGSMTWEMACHAPAGITAFLPMSGAFWLPVPTGCTAPVALRHLHGSADPTVPLAGRTIRQHFRLADIHDSLALLRATDRCTAPPSQSHAAGGQDCTEWRGCAPASEVDFCLHPGGHEMRADWTESGLRWALTQRR